MIPTKKTQLYIHPHSQHLLFENAFDESNRLTFENFF